jgi:chromosome segregation ATPase
MGLVRLYLEQPVGDASLQASLKKLLELNASRGRHEEKIEGLRERAGELRVRMDELHAQIFDLQALRTGGTLLTHLKDKMREISEDVQKNTLAIVAEQEQMTLVKVALADAISDVTLDKKAVAAR